MVVAVALASVVLFLAAFWRAGIVTAARRVVAIAAAAIAILRDQAQNDAAREAATRRYSLALFAAFAGILLRSASAVAVAALPILVADFTGLVRGSDVIGLLSRAEVFVAITAAIAIVWFVCTRRWRRR